MFIYVVAYYWQHGYMDGWQVESDQKLLRPCEVILMVKLSFWKAFFLRDSWSTLTLR